MTITLKALTQQVRPLRETIERSLTWEGHYTRPAPIQVGPFMVEAFVVTQRGLRPYSIWYKASRDGATVIEVDRQPEFVRLLARRLAQA